MGQVDPADRLCLFHEAVRPVASPGFIEQHRERLHSGIVNWQSLSFLDLSKHNYGWATWQDWFTARGHPDVNPDYQLFGNYVYLLEAAAAGKGLALGWQGLIERHLQTGVLLPLDEDYVHFDRGIHAWLTARGRGHPLARRFLACLGADSDEK